MSGGEADASILFLDQGRALSQAAMGHVRVRHALAAGGAQDQADLHLEFLEVPPFTRAQKRFTRNIPGLGRANLWSLRFVLGRGWLARKVIRERLRQGPLDVVHITTDQVAMVLGKARSKVPCVLSLDTLYVDWNRMTHGIAPDAPTPWYLRPIGRLEKRALEQAPLSIAWTETVARNVRRAAPGARVETLHPGLDLQAFRPRPKGGVAGPVRVLFVGGRWDAKGGPELLEALRPHLGNTVVLDVVTTTELPAINGVRMHRASPGSKQLAELFACADVCCLPTKIDACPWVVLEAMASGVPVVAARTGSIPEMVGEGGLITAPGDASGLRSALESLIEDGERRTALGNAGRARTEAVYDARKNTPVLLELLGSVTDKHGRRVTRRMHLPA